MYKIVINYFGRRSTYTRKILSTMKVFVVLILWGIMQSKASVTFAQKITLNERNTTLLNVIKKIRSQSGYDFVYNKDLVSNIKNIQVKVDNGTVEQALDQVLKDHDLTFTIENKLVVIKRKASRVVDNSVPAIQDSVITGRVIDALTKKPVQGVTVSNTNGKKSTQTNGQGEFRINGRSGTTITFSYIGYKQKAITIRSASIPLTIPLEESINEMQDIVINGIFTRSAETATGSQITVSGEKLLENGTINIIQSLRNIDPSFAVIDNNALGSDPNALPEINMRGQSGIPDLTGTYSSDPNLPLFILDGFETTLQQVIDLDMYRVSSVTLLKDAASKSIYGAKAGNGVVVIETIRPTAGKLRVSYNSNFGYSVPDLSSYNLTNASQKLQAELLAGVYTSTVLEDQYNLMTDYNRYLRNVVAGVNTDWMAQPLRNSLVQRQSLAIQGGDQNFTYGVTGTYNGNSGVMKGSFSSSLAGNISLNYRTSDRKLNILNNLNVQERNGENSPWGTFDRYAAMNPYLPFSSDGQILKVINNVRRVDSQGQLVISDVLNPAYNSTLAMFDKTNSTSLTNNTSLDWMLLPGFRIVGRFSFTKQINEGDRFLPADHTSFDERATAVPNERRGSYTKSNGKANSYDGQINLSYSKLIGKNAITVNGGATVAQNISYSNSYVTEGFPNDNLSLPSLGLGYQLNSRLSGSESTIRDMGVFGSGNYSFDQRYNLDATFRASQSSLYGINNRWANFWSTGLSWNIHNEKFATPITWLTQLRLRGSIGYTGTQGFNPYMSVGTYSYVRASTYGGINGANLLGLANPDLAQQKKKDYNIGVDFGVFKKLSGRAEYYIANTEGTLTDISLPLSSGFSSYKANLGNVENRGIELSMSYNVFQTKNKNGKYNSLSIFSSASKNTNKLKKISNALASFNDRQNELSAMADQGSGSAATRDSIYAANRATISRPKVLYKEGQSMSALYAVPSLGIDPATGKEMYRKLDGSSTYTWDINDQVVVGNTLPKWQGNVGFNLAYQGIRVNATFRYQFGGQIYNSTLVSKVENADIYSNVDVRVLTDRWQKPGDVTFFKNIADRSVTRVSSRFVEDNNNFTLASLQVGYDLDNLHSVKNLGFSQFRATLSSSELFVVSTVRTERGTSYPFARTVQLSLNANF